MQVLRPLFNRVLALGSVHVLDTNAFLSHLRAPICPVGSLFTLAVVSLAAVSNLAGAGRVSHAVPS